MTWQNNARQEADIPTPHPPSRQEEDSGSRESSDGNRFPRNDTPGQTQEQQGHRQLSVALDQALGLPEGDRAPPTWGEAPEISADPISATRAGLENRHPGEEDDASGWRWLVLLDDEGHTSGGWTKVSTDLESILARHSAVRQQQGARLTRQAWHALHEGKMIADLEVSTILRNGTPKEAIYIEVRKDPRAESPVSSWIMHHQIWGTMSLPTEGFRTFGHMVSRMALLLRELVMHMYLQHRTTLWQGGRLHRMQDDVPVPTASSNEVFALVSGDYAVSHKIERISTALREWSHPMSRIQVRLPRGRVVLCSAHAPKTVGQAAMEALEKGASLEEAGDWFANGGVLLQNGKWWVWMTAYKQTRHRQQLVYSCICLLRARQDHPSIHNCRPPCQSGRRTSLAGAQLEEVGHAFKERAARSRPRVPDRNRRQDKRTTRRHWEEKCR